MKVLSTVGVALCAALALTSVAAAQRPSASPGDDKAGVRIALQVDGADYRFSGRAYCTYIPNANIVAVTGQNWHVAHEEAARRVILSFLRATRGMGDMFSLHVTAGGNKYATNTITLSPNKKGTTEGSGKVTFEPAGTGGTFTIDATASNGAKISGTVTCDAFKPRREAVGGN
jgi:hypothetical protein